MKACPRHTLLQPGCRLCCLAATRQDYRDLWGIPGKADPADPCAKDKPAPAANRFSIPLPCVHRGEPTGETRPCPTCTGPVMVPLLQCQLKGTCTTSLLLPGVTCCRICPDRAEPR